MKEPEYHSPFHEFVCRTISAAKSQQLPFLIGCTANRCTRVFKRPEIAMHDEVLFYSRLLKKTVTELLTEFHLGSKGMTKREIDLHQRIDRQVKEPVFSE